MRSRVGEAEPLAHVIERAVDGERGGGENDGGELAEEPLRENLGDVDRRGLQENAAPALLHPVNVALVVAFHRHLERSLVFGGAALGVTSSALLSRRA
ncbi:MAG: hypothetical protein R2748_09305 [Bryobacterales bacterium]